MQLALIMYHSRQYGYIYIVKIAGSQQSCVRMHADVVFSVHGHSAAVVVIRCINKVSGILIIRYRDAPSRGVTQCNSAIANPEQIIAAT